MGDFSRLTIEANGRKAMTAQRKNILFTASDQEHIPPTGKLVQSKDIRTWQHSSIKKTVLHTRAIHLDALSFLEEIAIAWRQGSGIDAILPTISLRKKATSQTPNLKTVKSIFSDAIRSPICKLFVRKFLDLRLIGNHTMRLPVFFIWALPAWHRRCLTNRLAICLPVKYPKTHILIYRLQQMHKIRGRIDVQDLRSHEKAISGKATIAKIMQIVVGPAIKRLVTIELTGRMLVILSHVTSELFPQAFLSKIVNKDIESSICLGQNLIFLFHVNRGNRFQNKGGS